MRNWPAFWLLCAVYVVADAYMASTGMDSLLFRYRTPAELQLQKNIIDNAACRPQEETKQ